MKSKYSKKEKFEIDNKMLKMDTFDHKIRFVRGYINRPR